MINKNYIFICLIFLAFFVNAVNAQDFSSNDNNICAVYITGVGCPNCAITDPVLFKEMTKKYDNLFIIEYELYKLRSSNEQTVENYFDNYIYSGRSGVPFLVFNSGKSAIGRYEVSDALDSIESMESNSCPMSDGTGVYFKNLDITSLPGKIKIFTNDRVLISGKSGDNNILKSLLTAENINKSLEGIDHKLIDPIPVEISGGSVEYKNAAEVGDWIIQWGGKDSDEGISNVVKGAWKNWFWGVFGLIALIIIFIFYKVLIAKDKICFSLKKINKDYLIIIIAILFLLGFFILAKKVSPGYLEQIGYSIPLPIFTFFIALVDGFNPCNIFVLTFLLAMLSSVSHSRKKILTIGYTFVIVVFAVYFLFMIAWLNIFKYIGFATPLRIGIAAVALIAGIINCKELLFFRKGITLMIQDSHKNILVKKLENFKEIIKNGSTTILISSSIMLALFASLVELPCTAGFPIIYTGILSEKMLEGLSYYMYLLFYNLIYVVPLMSIITIFGYTFKGEKISKRKMQIIKFIGGFIMIILGIILLVNPSLIGMGMA